MRALFVIASLLIVLGVSGLIHDAFTPAPAKRAPSAATHAGTPTTSDQLDFSLLECTDGPIYYEPWLCIVSIVAGSVMVAGAFLLHPDRKR